MSILLWSCWGIGNPRAVQALRTLINKEDHMLVFLSETKLRQKTCLELRSMLLEELLLIVKVKVGGCHYGGEKG